MGVSAWLGYAIAAVYYVLKDQGYGGLVCESIGYAYIITEALNTVIDFGNSIEQTQ